MDIKKRADKLFSSTERTNAEKLWSDISKLMYVNQSGIFYNESTPGASKTRDLMDSTAGQAVHDLASAMNNNLTPPSSNWSKFIFKDDAQNNTKEVTTWLSSVNNIIHDHISESNFNTEVSKNYQAFCALGTMVLYCEADQDGDSFKGLRFEAWHLSQVAFSENKYGTVDTIYRKFKMTAKQIVEKFENVPQSVYDKLEENPDEEFKIYHGIYPRADNDIDVNPMGLARPEKRPFASVYCLSGSGTEGYTSNDEGHILEEGGFYEFPCTVPRWSTLPGEVYGRGCGHLALPDVKVLNQLNVLMMESIGRSVKSPWAVDRRSGLKQLDLRADAVNLLDDINSIKPLMDTNAVSTLNFSIEKLEEKVRGAFFIDKLLLPPRQETGEMTAFEIQQRLEQMQKVLGATLARLNSEFLEPMMGRIFDVLYRAGAFPETPEILKVQGFDINIRFINPLSRAQESEEINNIRSFLLNITELAQVSPGVLDYIDGDAIVKFIANTKSIPPDLIKDDKEVEAVRQQRSQQQQQQQAVDQGVGMADIISKTGGKV